MPAVGVAVPVVEATFDLEGLTATDGGVPAVQGPLHVVGVQDRRPALVTAAALAEAGELVPPAVEVVEVAVRSGRPDDLRHGVGQLPEPPLALLQRPPRPPL